MKKWLFLMGIVTFWLSTSAQTCPPASPLTTPLFDDLNGISAGATGSSFDNCWVANTISDPNWESEISGTSNSTSTGPDNDNSFNYNNGIYVYLETSGGAAGDTSGFISPPISLSGLTNPELSFDYHMYGSNMGELEVQVLSGGQWDSLWARSGQLQSSATAPWRWAGIDLSAYSGTVRIKFLGSRAGGFQGDMAIDNIRIAEATADTVQVSNMVVNSITSSSADVLWEAGALSATSWEVLVIADGSNFYGATATTATSDSLHLSGLMSNTTYKVFVREAVSGGFGPWQGPYYFNTLCNPFSAPYSSGFESDALDAPPACWYEYESTSSTFVEVEDFTGTAAPYAGSQALYLYSGSASSSDTLYAISPHFSDLNASDKQIRFWANSDGADADLYIGTTNDSTGKGAVNFLDTIEFAAPDTYQEVIVPFSAANGYNGSDAFIVLAHSLGATFQYIRIDEFNYELIPPCPQPTGLSVTGVTATSFTIDFQSNGTAFNVEWGPSGFTQGTGCMDTISSTTATLDNNSAPACSTPLAANTLYDVYLRNDCSGSGNGTSVWIGPLTFRTACASFTAPYFNDMESEAQDAPPLCWEDYETNSGSFVEVEDFTGTSAPYAGSQALYLYSSSAGAADSLWAISPRFSDLTAGDKRVNLFANSDGASSQLIIGTADTNTGVINFSPLDTITFAAPDTYEQIVVDITAANGYNGTDHYIVMAHSLGSTFQYVRIDNFLYEEIPLCVPPLISSLGVSYTQATSAELYWGSGSQGAKTYVEVGPPGFSPGTGAATVGDSVAGGLDSLVVSGLASNTDYEFYVQDSCQPGGLSAWIGPVGFKTACLLSAATLPFFDGFETYTGPVTTDGAFHCGSSFSWSIERPGGTGELQFVYSPSSGPSAPLTGSQSAGLTSLSSSNPIYLILTTDLSAYASSGGGVNLTFAFADHADEANDDDRVWARGSSSDPWVEIFDWSTLNSSSWDTVEIPLKLTLLGAGQSLSSSTQIRWGQEDNAPMSGGDGFSIDDVRLEVVACPDPTSLGVAAVSDTAAVLNWVGGGSASAFEVWFGPTGFFQGSQSTGGARSIVSTDSLLVDTLRSLTCYEFGVRTICGPGDTSAWVGPYNFCTACPQLGPLQLPFFDGFESFNNDITQESTFLCDTGYSYAMEDPGGSGNLKFNYTASSGPTPPYAGARSVGFESNSSSDPVFLIFTADLSSYVGIPNLQMLLSFYFADHFDETGADDKVWARGQIGDPWIEILDWNAANATVNWQYFEIRLDSVFAANSQSVSSSTQIRWGQMDNASLTGGDGFSIDNLSLMASTCPSPSNLSVSNATSTSVDVSWTSGGAANLQIEYGPAGFLLGSGTFASATSSPYTLTGLSPGTVYDLYIRDSCGAGDVSFPVGPAFFVTPCINALSGTYTLGPSGNFPSFDSVANALNICGVSGPVTINIQAGSYTDHLHLRGVPGSGTGIPGLSATNTLTFSSSGSDTLIWDGLGPQAAVMIENSGHITLDGMTIINNASSEGWGVFVGGNSDSVTITNSTIIVSDTTGAFASDMGGIVVSGDVENDLVTGAMVDGLTISNNEIIGGYYAVSLYGESTTSFSTNYQLLNNTIRNFYLAGVYTGYIDGLDVIGNSIRSTISLTDEDGLYLIDPRNFNVVGNNILVKDYGIYINDGNDGNTPSTPSLLANNMVISENDYGIYLNDIVWTNVYHNSSVGRPGIAINDQDSLDIQNNIFVSDNDFAFESFDALDAPTIIDYNLYYKSGTGSAFDIGISTYADLAAWQAADLSRNANSLEGNPIFVGLDDLHVIGSLADGSGNNNLGIPVDIDGDLRPLPGSSNVDIGADEFSAPSGDLAVIGGDFIKGLCLSSNDSIVLLVKNIIGSTIDFSVDPLSASFTVSGPVNSSGTITVNSGTLALNDTVALYGQNVDLSIPGTYTLTAYIDSSGTNALNFNDTLLSVDIDVLPNLMVSPQTDTLSSSQDSIQICAESSFFGAGSFFITEVMHFKTSTGAPTGGWPSWHTADEHIEITGVPGSDLAGITFEQWNTSGTAPSGSYTFPAGSVLGPNGTAVVAMRSVTPSPSDFFYDGSGGNTTDWQSGGGQGVILRRADGSIMDAVGYGSSAGTYSFPTAAGVTAADWTGATPSASGTCGIRLMGADVNGPSTWVVSSSSNTQDPNIVNTGVTVPAAMASGLTWTLNGVQIDTVTCIYAGPGLAPGTYNYIASYSNSCGSFSDTAVIVVPGCLAPSNFSGAALTTTSVQLQWDTTGTGATNFNIEYGPIGFSPGSGTVVAATGGSAVITALTTNLCQEYYIRSNCGASAQSPRVGPITLCPDEVPCDNIDAYATGPISAQSSLFIDWQGAGGDGVVSTNQANSSPNSLRIYDGGTSGFTDLVAYFDTISSGAWRIDFDMYVVSGSGAYFNIQQNHSLTGVGNQWGGEVYFQANGTAQVEYGSTTVGTFSYSSGQWVQISTIIDLTNDSIWIEYNGSSTGLGWQYSLANPTAALQFNGVNFYSGVISGGSYGIDYYMDNFCVTPYSASGCPAPTALNVGNEGCDTAEVSWTASSPGLSIVEYGLSGFTPGSGTMMMALSPFVISGLTPGTAYDVYVYDTCGTDTSLATGPASFSTLSGPLAAAFSFNAGAPTAIDLTVSFDASGSQGASSYSWDFGDGNNGNGVNTSHAYTADSSYVVCLTISGPCGSDTFCDTVVVEGISIAEVLRHGQLRIFPNPASELVYIDYKLPGSSAVQLSLWSVDGKKVIDRSLAADNGHFKAKIDLGKLPDGVYLLHLESEAGTIVRRLIVEQ